MMYIRICRECSKTRTIHGRGLCSNCYHKLGVNSVRVACACCGRTKPHYAKHLCKSCYNQKISTELRKRNPAKYRKEMTAYQHKRRQKMKAKNVVKCDSSKQGSGSILQRGNQ